MIILGKEFRKSQKTDSQNLNVFKETSMYILPRRRWS